MKLNKSILLSATLLLLNNISFCPSQGQINVVRRLVAEGNLAAAKDKASSWGVTAAQVPGLAGGSKGGSKGGDEGSTPKTAPAATQSFEEVVSTWQDLANLAADMGVTGQAGTGILARAQAAAGSADSAHLLSRLSDKSKVAKPRRKKKLAHN